MEEEIKGDLPAGNIAGHRILFDQIEAKKYYFVKFKQGETNVEKYVVVVGRNDSGAGMVIFISLAERTPRGVWNDFDSDYNEDVTRAQVNNVAGGISAHFYVPGTPSSRSVSSLNDPNIQRTLIATAPNARYRVIYQNNQFPGFTLRTRRRPRRRMPRTRRRRRGA
jgi:hypothetical protein